MPVGQSAATPRKDQKVASLVHVVERNFQRFISLLSTGQPSSNLQNFQRFVGLPPTSKVLLYAGTEPDRLPPLPQPLVAQSLPESPRMAPSSAPKGLGIPQPKSESFKSASSPSSADRNGILNSSSSLRRTPTIPHPTIASMRKQDVDLAKTISAVIGQLGTSERESLFLSCSDEEWQLLQLCAKLKIDLS